MYLTPAILITWQLFHEGNFEMTRVYFNKAGDSFWEKISMAGINLDL
jgi:hypothetical protein